MTEAADNPDKLIMNGLGNGLHQYKNNSCPETPEKLPHGNFDMSSDSNLEIQDSEKGLVYQWFKDNLLLMVTLAGVLCGAAFGKFSL